MSKAHRGSGIREQVNRGRGTCPVCRRSGIKTVFEYETEGKKVNICKTCKASISHGKMQDRLAAL